MSSAPAAEPAATTPQVQMLFKVEQQEDGTYLWRIISQARWEQYRLFPAGMNHDDLQQIVNLCDEINKRFKTAGLEFADAYVLKPYSAENCCYELLEPQHINAIKKIAFDMGWQESDFDPTKLPEKKEDPTANLAITYVGKTGNKVRLKQQRLAELFKKHYPTAFIHQIFEDDFLANYSKWDKEIFYIQNEQYLVEFIKQYLEEHDQDNADAKLDANKVASKAYWDIYISPDGKVGRDKTTWNNRSHADMLKAHKELVQAQTMFQKQVRKDDLKFHVTTEIVCKSSASLKAEKFKIEAVYSDSKSRGVVDLDLNNDLNENNIKAIIDWYNEQIAELADVEMEGVMYTLKTEHMMSVSIRNFCIHQLHAQAIKNYIDQYQAVYDNFAEKNKPD